MDVALGQGNQKEGCKVCTVLILVVMDVALGLIDGGGLQ